MVSWLPALVTQLTVRLLHDPDFFFLCVFSKTKSDHHTNTSNNEWDKRPLLGDGQFAARMIEYLTHSREAAGSQESGKQHPVAALRDSLIEQFAKPSCSIEMRTLLVRVYAALVAICRFTLTSKEWTTILRGATWDSSKYVSLTHTPTHTCTHTHIYLSTRTQHGMFYLGAKQAASCLCKLLGCCSCLNPMFSKG